MTILKNVRDDECQDRILNEYFDWMNRIVCDGEYSKNLSWKKLFRLLHETEFVYIFELDENRADDGIDLRYRFAYEYGYRDTDMDTVMGDCPCSVFEMMVALAHRCEEHIMNNPESGNQTGKWFFEMIKSLGLSDMDDEHFDKIAASDILYRFMHRKYQSDGRGGLFTVSNSAFDMRDDEIWYQMMHYLNENVYGRR